MSEADRMERQREDPLSEGRYPVWLYPLWKSRLAARLREGSDLLETPRGPVECNRGNREHPLVVGVHGSPGGYDQIASAFPGFPGPGFGLMTWSRPGYLRTSLSLGARFEQQADILAALLDAVGLDRVAVFAFSGGGPVAVHFAARYPNRVWALILESAVTGSLQWPRVWALESVFGNWLYNLTAGIRPREAHAGLLRARTRVEAETVKKLMDHAIRSRCRTLVLRSLLRSGSPATLRRAGLANDTERVRQLEPLPFSAVTAPTLILHGVQDGQVPLESAEHAARQIRRAELVRIPEGPHLLSLAESADEISLRRSDFLKRHAPSAGGDPARHA